MKKYLVVLVFVIPFIFSCGNKEKEMQQQQETQQLQGQVVQKDSIVNEMFGFLNEVESNLIDIEARQGKINKSNKPGEVKGDVKESITEHIQNINTLLEKNKATIAKLQKLAKESNMKLDALQKTIDLLNQQIVEKNKEIEDLKDQLQKLHFTVDELNGKVADLSTQSDQQQQTISNQTNELNTAYYILGTKKELKTKGILDGSKISKNLNTAVFTKVDITKLPEIALNTKSVKILSNHPESSYQLVKNGKVYDKITIKDAKGFWGISKYLIIQID